MSGRFRPPMFVIAGTLFGLIVTLATLQYRWLGRISDAERDRMRATLGTRTTEFAQDLDRELTRAYLLFQQDFSASGEDAGERIASRYDRWQATARFPRLLKDFYVVLRDDDGAMSLSRLNTASRSLEPCAWPPSMADWREQLGDRSLPADGGAVTIRSLPPPVWDSVPAIVVPMALVIVSDANGRRDVRVVPQLSYSILEIDRDYVTRELLPALAQQHFRGTGEGFDYEVAVVRRAPDGGVVYSSTPSFAPKPDAQVDASTDLFQVRTQDFAAVAAEVRRFTTFTSVVSAPGATGLPSGKPSRPPLTAAERIQIERNLAAQTSPMIHGGLEMRGAPMSIIVRQKGSSATSRGALAAMETATARLASASAPRWRLLLKHPSGSLEAAVNAARRRNLIVSTTILAVLGASVGLLILSTRRAQELARHQMEFVAAVSHELRTPLAVVRSAGENLADGIVRDDAQVRKYGDLVRNEGRRLTEMVEQILELAGIQSGQRGFALRPVGIRGLLEEVVAASATLIEAAKIQVEYDVPESVPPILGDEPSLRRAFQNLVGNAVKYGTSGRWIGLRARSVGREVEITVADRGIGIVPAEQARIFEPFYRAADVVTAQIQGAGLGLSLVKRTVEAHGGRITVRSIPGTGSEFTVVLPAGTWEPVGRTSVPGSDGVPAASAQRS